jgi:DNA-binding LacI/PurR family transcriptional regulator
MPGMIVNQRDIAQKLNLAVSTVSKSLRHCTDVSDETRARVLSAAAQMGYETPVRGSAPAGRANALRSRRRAAVQAGPVRPRAIIPVGLLFHWGDTIQHDVHQPGHEMLMGATDAAGELGVSLSIHFDRGAAGDWHDPRKQPVNLRSGQLRGLMFMYNFEASIIAQFAARYPTVTANHHHLNLGADLVGTDYTYACHLALRQLLDLGHRRIGFMSIGHSHGRQQFVGACMAAAFDLNMGPEQLRVADAAAGHLDRLGLAREAAQLSLTHNVTAWITKTNYNVYDLDDALKASGLRVGREVAVISLGGDQPDRTGLDITSYSPPLREMGAACVHQLLQRIEEPDRPATARLLQARYAPGKTVVPPQSRAGTGP